MSLQSITSPPRAPARSLQVGPEIANAWGWLLNRAPRIARTLEEWPGSMSMFARVLAAIDLLCHVRGLTPQQFGRAYDPEVTFDVHAERIIISLRKTR